MVSRGRGACEAAGDAAGAKAMGKQRGHASEGEQRAEANRRPLFAAIVF